MARCSSVITLSEQRTEFCQNRPPRLIAQFRLADAYWTPLDSMLPRNQMSAQSYFVHPTAVIDEDVEIGPETNIWHFAHVLSGSRIGARCVIGQNVVIGPKVRVGDGCKIQNNVSLYEGVTLEDDVFCGPSIVFTNVRVPRAHVNRKAEFQPTVVRRGASLGANATIICGNEIGPYAMVGAGAVVTRDVAAHALVVGNPGRQTGWVSRSGERLGPDLVCPRTGEHYRLEKGALLLDENG
jgi:UDP-2-acetamido-3-amino-2,3-dideoxy-glucuronate N-acetyltransferase